MLDFLRRGGILALLAAVMLGVVLPVALVMTLLRGLAGAPPAIAEPPVGLAKCEVTQDPHYFATDAGKERSHSFGPRVELLGLDIWPAEASALFELRDRLCQDPRLAAAVTATPLNRLDPNRDMPREVWQSELDRFFADPGWQQARLVYGQTAEQMASGEGSWTEFMVPPDLDPYERRPAGSTDPIVRFGPPPVHEQTTILVVYLEDYGTLWLRLECGFQPVGPQVRELASLLRGGTPPE